METDACESAFASEFIMLPPSPTKSASTASCDSPRTPTSPRKSKSCVFYREIFTDRLLQAPLLSPTKIHLTSQFRPLPLSDTGSISPEGATKLTLNASEDDPVFVGGPLLRRFNPFAHSNNRSAPNSCCHFSPETELAPNSTFSSSTTETLSMLSTALSQAAYQSSDPQTANYIVSSSSSSSAADTLDDALPDLEMLGNISFVTSKSGPNNLSRLPLRYSSSPLRPSQWSARGGLLSPQRTPTRFPDRFISLRRSPNATRESFELSRPADRLIPFEKNSRTAATSMNPFTRRLRRSGRLNEELRSLRDTHSVIIGRSSLNRRGVNSGLRRSLLTSGSRQVSVGAVWNVGGSTAFSDTVYGVSNGRGGTLGCGTNAPLYTSMFLCGADPEAELEAYERRLALALDVDQADKVLEHTSSSSTPTTASPRSQSQVFTKHVWKDNAWTKDAATMLLDAPQLRDDYYCSLLAYSHTARCLAVGLGNFVHLWSERKGVDTPESLNSLSSSVITDVQHVTSLAFSSTSGGQAILAVGRADGRIALWSPFDQEPRFDATQPKPISCVSFRPSVVKRPSLRDKAKTVNTEELLVGDEAGHIYIYSVEWPSETESALFGWHGAMTLLARMNMHTQQVCGLSWSTDGELFASGGNDNTCFLFESKKIMHRDPNKSDPQTAVDVRHGPNGENVYTVSPSRDAILSISPGREKHRWELNAAVKAIAFCPWQRGLLAVGGGSNDRCIHFYHTISGACLATIDCAAQVTALVWSTTRREIAATFGFAQPEHPFRIAVFTWPSCEQVVAVPWYDENRALFAIAYPGGPNTGRERGEDGVWWGRTVEEGCLVVAASDAAIRFHEIWAEGKRDGRGGMGLLGGSEILENLHGLEKEGECIIR